LTFFEFFCAPTAEGRLKPVSVSIREVKKLMENQGFKLLRQNRHLVWSDGNVTITTAASPSDFRFEKNVSAHIKRARRLKNEKKVILLNGKTIQTRIQDHPNT
jgi:hypothetical protein